MADGAYERRQGREAELKRFARIIAECRRSNPEVPHPKANVPSLPAEVVELPSQPKTVNGQ